MSISLLVSGKSIPETEWKNVPVATEAIFEKKWLPVSEELKLKYIPLFQVGFDVDADILPDVLRELHLLKARITENSVDNDISELSERVENLINFLPDFVKKYQTVFIG